MTTELTFVPGRIPGMARNRTKVRSAPANTAGMTRAQRAALAALIHIPARTRQPRFDRSDLGAGIAWIVITACALAWTLVIALTLAPEVNFARSFEVPQVAQAALRHVAEAQRAA